MEIWFKLDESTQNILKIFTEIIKFLMNKHHFSPALMLSYKVLFHKSLYSFKSLIYIIETIGKPRIDL